MRILLIVDPIIPVPPREYGGVERIAAALCSGLKNEGHTVDLMACPGSKAFGGRLFIHLRPTRSFLSRLGRKLWFQSLSCLALAKVDCVINFGRLDYLYSVLRSGKPLICCFHNPIPKSEVEWLLNRRYQDMALVGISQAQIHTVKELIKFSVIYNSTDTDLFTPQMKSSGEIYLAFLGRLTANKGVDTAISVAKKCGLKLKIAGNVPQGTEDLRFFEEAVKPHLGDAIQYVGEVNDEQKKWLLGGAKALLFPIRWPEPFGIVMAESLACGTPVIATRCASTPEVIDDGKTGFLVDSEDEMVEAVKKIDLLNRWECRRQAEERFSVKVMTRQYLELIHRLLSDRTAQQ